MNPATEFPYTFSPLPSRPVILCLHGFLGNKADWQPLTLELRNDFGILAVDLPGHGQNDLSDPAPFTFEHCARDLIGLLDQLSLEQVHLLGYSMGGRLGLYLLTHYPGRFISAVIESASPGLETNQEREERIKHDNILADKLEHGKLAVFLTEWYAQPVFGYSSKPTPRLDALIESRLNNDPRGLSLSLKQMGTGRMDNLWPALSEFELPMLLIAGESDWKYAAITSRMVDLCPNAERVIIADAGHNVHLDQPAEFTRQVKRFLLKNS